MFIRAPAHGEEYHWVTMGEAAAGNRQEHTRLKTYSKAKRKQHKVKGKDKKDKAVGKYHFWCFSAFRNC